MGVLQRENVVGRVRQKKRPLAEKEGKKWGCIRKETDCFNVVTSNEVDSFACSPQKKHKVVNNNDSN